MDPFAPRVDGNIDIAGAEQMSQKTEVGNSPSTKTHILEQERILRIRLLPLLQGPFIFLVVASNF